MTKLAFPLNYLSQIFTPKRAFLGRKNLTKFQIIIIFLFTSSLLLIPVTINMAKSNNFQLDEIMPATFALVDEEILESLNQVELVDGQLTETDTRYFNSAKSVGINLTKAELADLETGISFNQTGMYLKDISGYEFSVTYTKDFSPSRYTSVAELQTGISSQWLKQNRAFVTLTMILMSGSLILVSNLILVFGGAIFIYLTKKNSYSSIKTYQESVNLMLNASGLSSVISLIFGLVYFDMTLVLSIQSLGLVMMLFAIFITTRFNDDYAKNGSLATQK